MGRLKYRRYRVYPNIGRARCFDHLEAAVQFARTAFLRQSIDDVRTITVSIGSGSDYRLVGAWTVQGWLEYKPSLV